MMKSTAAGVDPPYRLSFDFRMFRFLTGSVSELRRCYAVIMIWEVNGMMPVSLPKRSNRLSEVWYF